MLNASLNYKILDWLSLSGRVRLDNSMNTYTEKYYAGTNTQMKNSQTAVCIPTLLLKTSNYTQTSWLISTRHLVNFGACRQISVVHLQICVLT